MKIKGIYFLYRVLQAFGLPVLLLYFLFRGFRNRAYWQSLPQRFGFLPHSFRQTSPGAIWLHAVSVGEVLACIEFVRGLRAEFPRSRLFVSASTLAGRATAGEKLLGLADGVFYAPVDYCFAVRRVLRTLKPSVVVVAETEIWPNLLREAKRIEAGVAIVNGRISDRAFPGYRRRRWFFQYVLRHVDAILAQGEGMAERFTAIGAPPERVEKAGNFKYDFQPREAPADSPVRRFLEQVHPGRVWIAASTMPPAETGDPDEDDAVIAAFRDLAPRHPDVLLVLVPRRPERFDPAAQRLAAAGVRFARRSALPASLDLPGVLLLDSIGELSGLFAAADVVFMGGTLARRGGHNILEPAFFARPVVVGPHMENFPEIDREFRAAQACVPIADTAALADAVGGLLQDRAYAAAVGARALACAEARSGATARAVARVRLLYDAHIPCHRPAWPWLPLAWALSRLWGWGGRRRMRRAALDRLRLHAPVVSVGNITMGGTGKTPCVLWLARALAARGRRPGVLTRGYGRGSPEKYLVVAAGASLHADLSGDEPQIFIRSGVAPVGIGADRYRTGLLLEKDFAVDVMLLDDGFQHVRLQRRADVVLIDALRPFGGRRLFPTGRLREPLPGLGRADVFLITRNDSSDLVPAIAKTVRRWNERAPVFHASVRPAAWVEHTTGKRFDIGAPPFQRAAAFCGLGNPDSFRHSLGALGVDLVEWVEFEDHHRYRPYELRRMALLGKDAGAAALVTTEKDSINLCDDTGHLIAPLRLFWLQVELQIDDEAGFLDAITARL